MSLQPPPINTYGVFTVLSPYTIDTIDYRCAAIQLISALVDTGVDVFTQYYVPVGLTDTSYQQDLRNNVSIITLLSEDGPTVYIPSSYISNIPVTISVPYGHLIVSMDLGELPDELALGNLLNYLTEIVTNDVGIVPKTRLHKISSKIRYSQSQHDILENTRKLNVTGHVSFYNGKVSADSELALAKAHIIDLEQIIKNLS